MARPQGFHSDTLCVHIMYTHILSWSRSWFTLLSIPWYEHYDQIDPLTGVSYMYSKSDLHVLRLILTKHSRKS
jgi:hypothetical protein